MKTRTIFILFLTTILTLAAGSAFGKYSGGSGTSADPYCIVDYNDLYVLADDANDYNKCFIQTSDIDLNPDLPGRRTLTKALIAADTNATSGFQGTLFTGTYDGNDCNILNLTINGNDFLGLFGNIGSGGAVRNLALKDVNITSTGRSIGGLAGCVNFGIITNCSSTGAVKSTLSSVGGLVGLAVSSSSITNCFAAGTVSSYDYVNGWDSDAGGLVGSALSGSSVTGCFATAEVNGLYVIGGLIGVVSTDVSVTGCYAIGAVSGEDTVGGLAGDIEEGTVTNSYATGTVSGVHYVGGLIGDGYEGIVSNCYSTGNVTGREDVGGLVGHIDGSISNCYSTGAVSGSSEVGGLVGYNINVMVSSSYFFITSGPANGAGTPLTDTQLKQQSSFVGWDFTAIWAICEGTNYPRLIWQIPAGDWVCPDGVNFADFAYFAEWWHTTGCNSSNNFCGGADMDSSGTVDMQDLAIFAANWLTGE